MSANPGPPVLFEMLRSFTTLAHTLNLSKAAAELGVTRQTVRRHIDTLEQIKGQKLFRVSDRRYEFTPAGSQSLTDAEAVLARAQTWLTGHSKTVNGLTHVKYQIDGEYPYYAQQHPANRIWSDGVPLIKKGLQIWATSQTQLEHRAMKKLRPYLVIYRKYRDDWLCVNIGEKSSYATWLGWAWANSAIGSALQEDPMNTSADRFVAEAYNSVFQDGGIRYDHGYTKLPRKTAGPAKPVSYQRLVFACVFPDGQPAVAVLLARTGRIQIDGLDSSKVLAPLSADFMEFDI